MKPERAALVAMVTAVAAVMAFAVGSDAIQPRHVFASPILYVLLGIGMIIGLPLYALVADWLGIRLERFLLAGALMMPLLWLLLAIKWGGMPPLNARAILWIVGHPLAAVLAFWAVLAATRRRA